MRSIFLATMLVATISLPVAVHAQGTIRGAQDGAAVGGKLAPSEQ